MLIVLIEYMPIFLSKVKATVTIPVYDLISILDANNSESLTLQRLMSCSDFCSPKPESWLYRYD